MKCCVCNVQMKLIDKTEAEEPVYECPVCGRDVTASGNTPLATSPEADLVEVFGRNEQAHGKGYAYIT